MHHHPFWPNSYCMHLLSCTCMKPLCSLTNAYSNKDNNLVRIKTFPFSVKSTSMSTWTIGATIRPFNIDY